jgi:hypothetical protein
VEVHWKSQRLLDHSLTAGASHAWRIIIHGVNNSQQHLARHLDRCSLGAKLPYIDLAGDGGRDQGGAAFEEEVDGASCCRNQNIDSPTVESKYSVMASW